MIARSTADAARVASMAAVLVIHATQPSCDVVLKTHEVFSVDTLAMVLNQAARFCVPMFILLSGYGLAAREQVRAQKRGCGHKPVDEWSFYKDRLGKIVVPFALWSLIYFLWSAPWQYGVGTTLEWLLRDQPIRFLTGQAQYHLYFIPIIVQCYLLFPFLMRLYSHWWTALLFGVTLVFTWPSQEILTALGIQALHLPAWFIPVWIAWFFLGMQLGKSSEHLAQSPIRFGALGALLVAVAAVIGDFWYNSYRVEDAGAICHFNRWSVLCLVAACCWNLWAWNYAIARWLASPRKMAVVQWCASVSFAVYFVHPLILSTLQQSDLQNPFVILLLLMGTSGAVVFGVGQLLKKTPRLGQALGW